MRKRISASPRGRRAWRHALVLSLLLSLSMALAPVPAPAAEDPYAGRPLGQCIDHSDCLGSLTCTTTAPGGICNGCANDVDCAPGSSCFFGACVVDCSVDDDCAPGFRCTPQGRCAVLSCVATCDVPLYGCGASGFCERIACPANACPADTTCIDGLCMEDRQLGLAVPGLGWGAGIATLALLVAGSWLGRRRRPRA